VPIPRLLLRARGLGIARGVVPVRSDCRTCRVGGDDMMDDYSRITMLESELSSLRNELTTAYMVGYQAGMDTHPLYDYLPGDVIHEILEVLRHGDIKHPGEEWKKVLPHVHIQHGGEHLWEFSAHGRDREAESGCYHLAHAIVRYMMALAQYMGEVQINEEEV
jgi:hypothetical protein